MNEIISGKVSKTPEKWMGHYVGSTLLDSFMQKYEGQTIKMTIEVID